MITENVTLKSTSKKKLKHLSIDAHIPASSMLVDGAEHILAGDVEIIHTKVEDIYSSFTMKIPEEFKERIKKYCIINDFTIKDFWNTAAIYIIDKYNNLTIAESLED